MPRDRLAGIGAITAASGLPSSPTNGGWLKQRVNVTVRFEAYNPSLLHRHIGCLILAWTTI